MEITSPAAPASGGLAPNRRTQERISVEIPVALVIRGQDHSLKGLTKDISWGGVLLSITRPLPPDTRVVRVVLPWKRKARINAMAQVQRTKLLQDSTTLVALRFLSLSPRSSLRLEGLLDTLTASTSDERAGSGGLVKELEVSVTDIEELRGIMDTIATGRYTCTVFEAYSKGQSLCFVLAGTEEWTGIRLRARVIEIAPTALTGYRDVALYSMTLQFEHPKESLAKLIDFILGQLPESSDSSVLFGWSQMTGQSQFQFLAPDRPSKNSKAPSPHPPIKSNLRSTLELDFPEALSYLMLGWGDEESFDVVYRELVIGDRSQVGGWPPDAWEELVFLQEVHDHVYGITKERKRFLKFGS